MKENDASRNALTSHHSLIDRRFNVNPNSLVDNHLLSAKPTEEEVSRFEQCLRSRSVLTPVLIDNEDRIVAGSGLVKAAIRRGCDVISAYRLDEFSAEDLKVYAKSLIRFTELLRLDRDLFRADAEQIGALADIIECVAKSPCDAGDNLTV